MELLIAEEIGFCNGIKRALKIAQEALSQHEKVYAYGALLHNARAKKEIESQGLITIESIDEIPDESTVIIRSHGITAADYNLLKSKGCKILDATCPSVKAIHEKVISFSEADKLVIIVGKPDHPEVIGIQSRCKASVVANKIDEFFFPDGYKSYLVVAQTTLDCEFYEQMVKKIAKMSINNSILVEFYKSICYTNIERQFTAKNIANEVDVMLIIGDENSSNTRSLSDIASRFCQQTYIISEVTDIGLLKNKVINKLGISAGASTPKELIMEVINIMEQEFNVNNINESELNSEANAETDKLPTSDESRPNETLESSINENVVQELTNSATEEKAEDATQESASQDSEAKSQEVDVESVSKDAADADKPVDPPKVQTEFERYMKTDAYNRVKMVREGYRMKACVEVAGPSGVIVSLMDGFSGKNDSGFIDKSEMELDGSYNPSEYTPGTILEVLVIPKTDPKMKGANLSKKQVDAIKIEDEAAKKILEGEEFSFACTHAIKGGLMGKLGSYTIFVPGSQIRTGYVSNLEDYIGKKLRLKVLPPKEDEAVDPESGEVVEKKKRNNNSKRIVASQRIILDEEREAKENAFWEIVQPNHIIQGKVKKFTTFGAFVNIMGHDCLVHISDVSWNKLKDASEVLKLNSTYEFLVLKADREEGRVSLGYKQLQKTPAELAKDTFKVGDVVKGTVVRVKDFGVFVNILPGVDGLIHISELGTRWVSHPSELLKPGDEVEVKILALDTNKITLSIRALIDESEQEQPAFEFRDEDKKPQKDDRRASSGISRFNNRFDRSENQKEKHDKRNRRNHDDNYKPDEHMEHTAAARTATFGDLFKNFDMKQFEKDD